jgi:hypothetical protein
MDKQELQKSAEAKSDQIDADDMIGNITMDVTIEAVKRGTSEQPIQLVLKETEKFYRPNKTFRRALIGCFGDEPANWVGQRLRLARDPNVMWGGVKVGGVIVSHASIEAPMVFMLQAKRGKKSAVSIDVIPPIQKPTPMPQEVKAKGATLRGEKPVRGTISGDPSEGDLSGIAEPPPAADKPDGATLSQVINAFATKLSMTAPMIEAEYNKQMAEWTNADVAEARELFKHLLAERKAMAGDGGEV